MVAGTVLAPRVEDLKDENLSRAKVVVCVPIGSFYLDWQ